MPPFCDEHNSFFRRLPAELGGGLGCAACAERGIDRARRRAALIQQLEAIMAEIRKLDDERPT